MKFFVDTAEIDAIAELNDLGMVDGVTTLMVCLKLKLKLLVSFICEIILSFGDELAGR